MFSLRDNLLTIEDGAYVINFDDKQDKRTHWGIIIHYSRRLCKFILLELNIFRKKYQVKLNANPPHPTYLEYNLMIPLYVDFTVLLS